MWLLQTEDLLLTSLHFLCPQSASFFDYYMYLSIICHVLERSSPLSLDHAIYFYCESFRFLNKSNLDMYSFVNSNSDVAQVQNTEVALSPALGARKGFLDPRI